MPDVDGGFQCCCCGNRGTGGIARQAEDFWGVGGLLKDSEHEWERLPAPSPTVPLA